MNPGRVRGPQARGLVIGVGLVGAAAGAMVTAAPSLLAVLIARVLMVGVVVAAVRFLARGDLTSSLLVAVVAGVLQGFLANLDSSSQALLADDLVVGVLVLITVVGGLRSPAMIVVVAAISASLLLGVLQAPMASVGVLQARQVGVAAGLMFVGAWWHQRIDWHRFARGVVYIAVACSLYSVLERLGYHPLDPVRLADAAEFRGGRVVDGLPAYYRTSVPWLGQVERSGSLFLNPPTAGLFLGTALALSAVSRVNRPVLVRAILVTGLLLTVSKGGLVIAGLVFGLLWSRRFIGRTLAVVSTGAMLTIGAQQFLDVGNNNRHLEGLLVGISGAVTSPLGHGFGRVGNLTVVHTQQGVGESLLGLYFYSCGALALGFVLAALHRMVRGFYVARAPLGSYIVAIGLAAILSAALSESATGLAASLPLWICAGAAVVWTRKQ